MKINYIEYLKKDRVLDPNSLPDMPDEQAESVYCDLIVQISKLSYYYSNFTLLSLASLLGMTLFSVIFLAVNDLTTLQTILVLTGLIPCCLSWIYFSIGVYVLTYRQPKIEKSLEFIERDYPAVAEHLSNQIIFYYNYSGGASLSYSRAMLLSMIASPICGVFLLGLKGLNLIESADALSNTLICIYIALAFVISNFLYIKYCKARSNKLTNKKLQ
jgi:hypothetical protein